MEQIKTMIDQRVSNELVLWVSMVPRRNSHRMKRKRVSSNQLFASDLIGFAEHLLGWNPEYDRIGEDL